MLKFTRAFSLEHDIIPHIPVEQLPPEAKTFIEHNATVIGMAMGVPKLHNSSAELNSLPTFTSNPMLQTLPPNFNTPPARTSYRSNFRLGSSYSGLNSPGSNQNSPHSSIRYSHQPSNGHHDDDDDNDYGNNSGLLEDDDDAEGSNNDMNNFLNSYNNQRTIAHMINLRIIGRDSKSGILVIARNARINDIQKTCIDLFDINSKKYTNVLDYSGLIISATLSSDAKKSFLIFTVQLPDSSPDPNVNRLYSSFIYEMNKRNNIFHSLEKSSTHIPVYHCLHVEQKYLHLLSIQNDECSTIRVPIQDEKSNGYSLPPKFSLKKNSFTKKFFWYQYDDINHVLYVLQYLKLRSLNAPSENLLKKWVFREGKIHQSGEFPIFLNNTTDRVSSNFPYPFTLPSPKSDQVVQNIHIVQLDSGACLCHQEESTNTSIRISVYFLFLKQKLKFSIPLASIDGGVLSIQVTRVLFDSMGNYLLIFVPGHFLQLIDCSSPEHDPSIGITLYNLPTHIKEMTSHDSSDLVSIRTRPYPTKISTSILPFYVFSKSEQNLLFDYHHGILYRYLFDRKSISNLFQKETIAKYGLDNGADLRALHLVMMHMQDSELVLKILVNVSNEPQLISSDLLKEYILGQTYLEMKGSKLDPLYLQALPMTCSDTMDISLLRSKLKDIELTNINWQAIHQIFLGNSNSNNKMIDPKKRLRSFEVVKQEGWQKESGSVVTSFIKSFFGVDDNRPDEISSYRRYESGPLSPTKTQANSKIPIKYALDDYEEDPLFDITNYASNLADHWHQISQKESKEKLIDWANNYRNVQINTINALYQTLVMHIGGLDHQGPISRHPKKSQLFRVLEKLYIAIEELSCPFPKDFYSTFTILGFYCLPRKVFLQYLQKGLFVVTSSFIAELRKYYIDELTVEDRHFINQVILHLRDKSKMISHMHNWTLNTGVINDHLISNLIQKGDDPKGDFDQTGPDFSNSNFIPLTSLFMHLDRCVALSATQLARAGAPVTSPNKTAPISVSPSSSSPPPANININATNNGIGVGLGGNGSGSGNGGSGSFSNYNIANGGSISSATLFSSDYHNLNFVKHHYEAEMAIILQQSASTNNNNNNKK